MILSTYLNAQVIFLLDDPNMFNVPQDRIGAVSGLLIFVSLPGAIIGTFFVGYVCFDLLESIFYTIFIIFNYPLTAVLYNFFLLGHH